MKAYIITHRWLVGLLACLVAMSLGAFMGFILPGKHQPYWSFWRTEYWVSLLSLNVLNFFHINRSRKKAKLAQQQAHADLQNLLSSLSWTYESTEEDPGIGF